jgi:hypothetical protein
MTRSSKLFGSWRSAVMMLAALAITGSLLNSVSAQPQPSAPTGRSLSSITGPAAQRNAFRRLKYFHDQRAYPNTRIPAGAYQKAPLTDSQCSTAMGRCTLPFRTAIH